MRSCDDAGEVTVEGDCFSPLRFDSADLPVADQYRTFASAMVNFDMARDSTGPFAARALIWRIGALVVTQVTAGPVQYDRPLSRVRGDKVDHIYLNYHFRGAVQVDCGRGAARAGPGSLLVIDMRQPCRMDVGSIEEISVAVPRHLIMPRLESFDPHGLIATGGMTELLGATLRTICTSLPKVEPVHASTLERAIMDLAADAVLEALSKAEATTKRQEALASRVRSYIDAHLAEPLDVAAICAGVGVSRSSLYRAFGGSGGVLRQLQSRRLRKMHQLLDDPAETRSIAALAQVTGFADKSHFARLFKRAYGTTPGQFRAMPGARDRKVRDHHVAQVFGDWVSELG
ncbi:helix-turn-helix domain-containing protein [Sphingomonas sp. CL5.1]|uniref:AraC-like ligand-binding domain-containing protein n=1 Tax=Sphingomonas sp. CL5.1 TaxID=2653203 RepID=UPI00158171FD|nr:helix-turn-helix domain-containing protein [Sphingomonas sp. CL5.1]QKS00469.1 helix-turn-helix domain-containing protein [Sphingomonas sp. CL5.1]